MKLLNYAVILCCGLLTAACSTYEPGKYTPDIKSTVASKTGFTLDEIPAAPVVLAGNITLGDAAQAALTGNPRLIAALEGLNVASADEIQAGLLLNPALSGEFVFDGNGSRPNLDFGLAFEIGQVFSRSQRMNAARIDREVAEFEVTSLIVRTVFEAQQALLALWQAQERLELFQEAARIAKAESDTAKLLHTAGNLTAGALAAHLEAWQQASLDAGGAMLAVIEAQQNLATLVGAHAGATAKAQIDHQALNANALNPDFMEHVLRQSITLQSERKRIEALGTRLGLAKISVWLDHLELEAIYEREDDSNFGFGATVPVPLFDWGQARTGKAKAILNAAEQRYKALYLATRNLAQATQNYVQILKEAAGVVNAALLDAADQKLEFDTSRFNAMQIGPFDLLIAKKSYIETKMRALDIQYLFASTALKAKALEAGVSVSAAEIKGATQNNASPNEGEHP